MRIFSVAAVVFAAAACTPDYNWRQAGAVDVGAQILLPARPAELRRSIELDGLAVEMSMLGARTGEQTFTLAWIVLPDAMPATRERVLAAMVAGMLRNIDARETERSEREVSVVDASGARVASQPALAIVASGQRPVAGTSMRAIFVARGNRAWQAVAMGTALDAEAVTTFLESFTIRQP